jgi:hypothetical protein
MNCGSCIDHDRQSKKLNAFLFVHLQTFIPIPNSHPKSKSRRASFARQDRVRVEIDCLIDSLLVSASPGDHARLLSLQKLLRSGISDTGSVVSADGFAGRFIYDVDAKGWPIGVMARWHGDTEPRDGEPDSARHQHHHHQAPPWGGAGEHVSPERRPVTPTTARRGAGGGKANLFGVRETLLLTPRLEELFLLLLRASTQLDAGKPLDLDVHRYYKIPTLNSKFIINQSHPYHLSTENCRTRCTRWPFLSPRWICFALSFPKPPNGPALRPA